MGRCIAGYAGRLNVSYVHFLNVRFYSNFILCVQDDSAIQDLIGYQSSNHNICAPLIESNGQDDIQLVPNSPTIAFDTFNQIFKVVLTCDSSQSLDFFIVNCRQDRQELRPM